MKTLRFVLANEEGLHARPAMDFVETAQKFKSAIHVLKDGEEFSAKSIVSVLSMGGCQGDEVEIVAEGEDEEAAVDALNAVVCAME
jgi:phosphocarrier protein HPr